MAQVTLTDLAKTTGLEPKVIRRLLRKAGFNAPYLWDDTNPLYNQALEVCKEVTKSKLPQKPKRERVYPQIKWDDRGLCIIDGSYWALVAVPTKEDPSIREEESIWLGRLEEVESILRGERSVPEGYSHLQRLAITQILEGGEEN